MTSTSARMPTISAVVPVYNEVGNLRPLHAELESTLARLGNANEIIYVDDRSTDGSFAVLEELATSGQTTGVLTRLVRLRRNYGQTAAMAAGFERSRNDIVVALDGDGQNDPSDIPRLMAKISEGFDVVSGWRRRRRDVGHRVWMSRVANWLLAKVSGVPLHDSGCTLKAYRRPLLAETALYGEMHRFIPAYLARHGARVTEIEVGHRPRAAGSSKYGSERVAKVMLDLVLLLFISRYFARPMHFFGQVALAFAALLAGVSLLMLALKMGWPEYFGVPYQADFTQTPLPALAATFLAAAITALLLGVLAELVVRVYFEIEGRRPFTVETLPTGAAQAPPPGSTRTDSRRSRS